ncbi:hypothetical protein M2367_003046 [Aeromonas sp. BIGb0445]|nr:hypothetical protein [Aeromonas sp. BIGb0445]
MELVDPSERLNQRGQHLPPCNGKTEDKWGWLTQVND